METKVENKQSIRNGGNTVLPAVSLDEAAEIMQTLMAYGNIRPIEGVVYPEGTHKEILIKANEWLWRYRSARRNGR
mgnify:CR=1 FL=1